MNHWIEAQVEGFLLFEGSSITGWLGQEMAFREGPSGAPEFTDPTIPYLQLNALDVATDRGAFLISTYQNDNTWGLGITRRGSEPPDEYKGPSSFFRCRRLVELPTGRVESVRLAHGVDDDIEEVTLSLGGKRIILWAGEVYEERGGGLRVERPDESILIAVQDS